MEKMWLSCILLMCVIGGESKFLRLYLISLVLTHLSLASLLWDIGKQNSPRCDAAERGVPSGAILFAWRSFIEKLIKI